MMLIVRAMRVTLSSIGAAAILVALAACVVQPPAQRYTRPDTTQQQFMQDRYECLQEAQRGPVASCSLISSCMGARGYILTPGGDLAPPPGMAVACQY
jgi:predicted small lipoprotein YifL